MLLKILKAKLHRAKVTAVRLDYPGSIAIDSALLDAAGILPYESVLVANMENGRRFETYVVPADAGSGRVEILGAAANLASPGDRVIILCFAFMSPAETKGFRPKVIVLDEDNRIKNSK
jgi:aspartate 1-decarboxylase